MKRRWIVSTCALMLTLPSAALAQYPTTTGLFQPPQPPRMAGPVSSIRYGPATEVSPPRAAAIDVRVPAQAELWFNGTRMGQPGAERQFITPPLNSGTTYHYDIDVRWQQGSRKLFASQRIAVRAGDHLLVEIPRPGVPIRSSIIEAPIPHQVRSHKVPHMSLVELQTTARIAQYPTRAGSWPAEGTGHITGWPKPRYDLATLDRQHKPLQ